VARTSRIETWSVAKQGRDANGRFLPAEGPRKRVGRIVVRNADGTIDGATNVRQVSKVGQVRKSRRG
jgi:hypothetical protein